MSAASSFAISLTCCALSLFINFTTPANTFTMGILRTKSSMKEIKPPRGESLRKIQGSLSAERLTHLPNNATDFAMGNCKAYRHAKAARYTRHEWEEHQ